WLRLTRYDPFDTVGWRRMQFDQLKRREFVTVLSGMAAWPIAARAQPDAMRRIGVLMGPAESDPQAQSEIAAFRHGLQKLVCSGRCARIPYRWAAGEANRMRTSAR